MLFIFFFFNDTATTEIYTLSLHDALPIYSAKKESIDTILEMAQLKTDGHCKKLVVAGCLAERYRSEIRNEIPEIDFIFGPEDRKSTRLNSSHSQISYAVFCLKKKKKQLRT